ncbi:MAG: preprotein translocase subunit YajC [Elusimicrobiota bacterium]
MKLIQFKGLAQFYSLTAVITFFTSPLFSMASQPSNPNSPPPPAWVSFAPMLVMVAIFYFLLIRPQMRQRKERENLLNNLKRGDRIVTSGGLIGIIQNVSPKVIDLKISEDTKVQIVRTGIVEVLTTDPSQELVPNVPETK